MINSKLTSYKSSLEINLNSEQLKKICLAFKTLDSQSFLTCVIFSEPFVNSVFDFSELQFLCDNLATKKQINDVERMNEIYKMQWLSIPLLS